MKPYIFSVAFASAFCTMSHSAGHQESTKSKKPVAARPGASVVVESNIVYGQVGESPLKLDVVRPKNPKSKKLPVVAFIHGGGWANGDKRSGIERLTTLAATGEYFCCSIGYRLTGEAIWPAQIHDCKAAIRWLRANAGKYDLDTDRIGVWGNSAGGHLAALLATTADSPELEGSGGNAGLSSRVACGVIFFGPSDLSRFRSNADGKDWKKAAKLVDGLVGGNAGSRPEVIRSASPISHVSKGDAPLLLMHGDSDELVPIAHSRMLLEAYRQDKLPASLVVVEGGGHAFKEGTEVRTRVRKFFDKYLRGQDVPVSTKPINLQEEEDITNEKVKVAKKSRSGKSRKEKADLFQTGNEWKGHWAGNACDVRVVERSDDFVAIRITRGNGAAFRLEGKVKKGVFTLTGIKHVKLAPGTASRFFTSQQGSAWTKDGKLFVRCWGYNNVAQKKNIRFDIIINGAEQR